MKIKLWIIKNRREDFNHSQVRINNNEPVIGKHSMNRNNFVEPSKFSWTRRGSQGSFIVVLLSFLILSSTSSFFFIINEVGSQALVKKQNSMTLFSLPSLMAKNYDKGAIDNAVKNNDNTSSPSKGGSILSDIKSQDPENQDSGMALPFDVPSIPSSSTSTDEAETPSSSSIRSLDLPDQSFSPAAISPGDLLHVFWDDNNPDNHEILHNRVGADHDPTTSNISNNPSSSTDVEVAVSGSIIHVVWEDNSSGDFDVFYQRSTNGGASFGPVIDLSNNLADSIGPQIAVSGNTVHVVWSDDTPGNREVFYRRSTDGGVSFTDPIKNLSGSATFSDWPSIAVSGNNVHVVWAEFQATVEILYRRSTNGGSSFPSLIKTLSAVGDNSNAPEVAVSGNNVHVVWKDDAPGNVDVFYRKSATNGDTFQAIKNLSGSAGSIFPFARPSIAVNGNNVHVVWDDDTSGNSEILYRRSIDGGNSFPSTITNLSNNDLNSLLPTVAVSGNNIYTAWTQFMPSGDFDVFYRTSADNGVSFPIAQTNISNDPGISETPAIAVSQA